MNSLDNIDGPIIHTKKKNMLKTNKNTNIISKGKSSESLNNKDINRVKNNLGLDNNISIPLSNYEKENIYEFLERYSSEENSENSLDENNKIIKKDKIKNKMKKRKGLNKSEEIIKENNYEKDKENNEALIIIDDLTDEIKVNGFIYKKK